MNSHKTTLSVGLLDKPYITAISLHLTVTDKKDSIFFNVIYRRCHYFQDQKQQEPGHHLITFTLLAEIIYFERNLSIL